MVNSIVIEMHKVHDEVQPVLMRCMVEKDEKSRIKERELYEGMHTRLREFGKKLLDKFNIQIPKNGGIDVFTHINENNKKSVSVAVCTKLQSSGFHWDVYNGSTWYEFDETDNRIK